MKCCDCKYYCENRDENKCKKFGFEYFEPFFESDCLLIDDDYNEKDFNYNDWSISAM